MFSGIQSNPEKKRYDRISFIYDWMEFIPEKLFMSRWRKQAIQGIGHGLTMELGVGTGKNLPNYPEGQTIIGVDISLNMIRKARNKVGESMNVQFALMNAEQLAFKENVGFQIEEEKNYLRDIVKLIIAK